MLKLHYNKQKRKNMDKYLILVNKVCKLNPEDIKGFEMQDVTTVEGHKKFIEQKTAEAFAKLEEIMKAEGVQIGYNDAGRTKEDCDRVYREIAEEHGKAYADSRVAPEGASEHLTGLAIDVKVQRTKPTVLDKIPKFQSIDRARMYRILHTKLAECGFILRYPEGKEKETGYPHEPWHIRYVGEKHAKEIAQKGITLEKYLSELEQQKNAEEAQPGM